MVDKTAVLRAVPLVFVSVLFLLGGCKRDQPKDNSAPQPASDANQETQSMWEPQEPNMLGTLKKTIGQAMAQTTCPVMGGPIDQAIFTEYQEKKVYFCCPECLDKFNADPEQYLAKLPQFKIQDPNAIKSL